MSKLPLSTQPVPQSAQYLFEKAISEALANYGVFAIKHDDNTKYINPHINWLWVQYKKKYDLK